MVYTNMMNLFVIAGISTLIAEANYIDSQFRYVSEVASIWETSKSRSTNIIRLLGSNSQKQVEDGINSGFGVFNIWFDNEWIYSEAFPLGTCQINTRDGQEASTSYTNLQISEEAYLVDAYFFSNANCTGDPRMYTYQGSLSKEMPYPGTKKVSVNFVHSPNVNDILPESYMSGYLRLDYDNDLGCYGDASSYFLFSTESCWKFGQQATRFSCDSEAEEVRYDTYSKLKDCESEQKPTYSGVQVESFQCTANHDQNPVFFSTVECISS